MYGLLIKRDDQVLYQICELSLVGVRFSCPDIGDLIGFAQRFIRSVDVNRAAGSRPGATCLPSVTSACSGAPGI
jgi:hypothetical protein